MYKIDFNQPIHVHFIGIGGISMSGLAEILLQEHFTISGSDSKESDITTLLEKLGATVTIGQQAENITDDIDLIVYTAAVHSDNPEFKAAQESGKPILTRAQLLGQIMSNYQYSMAVSGTHGKTTTTSMLSHVLLAGNVDPTISIGGMLNAIGGNIRVGHSEYFVTEACEYTNSFHAFQPKISIILNVDADHLDFFSGIEEIIQSFRTFAHKLPEDGTLVINGEMDCLPIIIEDLNCNICTFGLSENCKYRAEDIEYDASGCASYTLLIDNSPVTKIKLNVNGVHNVTNSLATIAVADVLHIDLEDTKKGLESFDGAKRRFEIKGTYNGITIVDDYAHHPTEIQATLTAAKQTAHNEIWCVFQPHTYTRTKALLPEFAEALHTADHVVLTKIYAAREQDTGIVSSQDIADLLQKEYQTDVVYLPTFEEVETYLKKNCKKNDLLITMGAGDIVNVGENLLKK
ncbi:MAG: UDP-N-acetylmuramate--L-alanine ligase [Lachnospiraceae bacterium]|nr:UDP-N-acetylmuramate--L-alanine ligase [Lachnospiraceae bacterium]